jgi:hypothetical protein
MIRKQAGARPQLKMKMVERAIKAIDNSTDAETFGTEVKRLNKDDWQELMKQLPEDRVNNPRSFYRVAKAVARLNKKSKLVKGFIIDGEEVSLRDGLRTRITELYRPPNTPCLRVRIARDQQ